MTTRATLSPSARVRELLPLEVWRAAFATSARAGALTGVDLAIGTGGSVLMTMGGSVLTIAGGSAAATAALASRGGSGTGVRTSFVTGTGVFAVRAGDCRTGGATTGN